MNQRFVVTLLTGVLLATAACSSDSPSTPSQSVPYSQTDLRIGTGAEALTGRFVTVNYTGWLYAAGVPENKGTQFDSSLSPGRQPFSFTLGRGQVIAGWDQGVVGMRVGGQRRLVIPPNLAYGSSGSGPIPPNATLVFDIELLAVQ
jgi:FKBP-type peptidyl-prolyl cis-trans isomerase FkpA